jgi:dihydrofolate reductase
MDAIVAVYSNWGIGERGTQPIVLAADRKHFRDVTYGSAVIVGRRTMEDFPGGKPLNGRQNIVVTGQDIEIEGAIVVHTVDEALMEAAKYKRCFVIGGASIFLEFLPHTDRIFATKIELAPHSDSFFPDLDSDPDWQLTACGERGEENGVGYRFCTYERRRRK